LDGPLVIEAVFLGVSVVLLFSLLSLSLEFGAVEFGNDLLGHGNARSEEPGIESRVDESEGDNSDQPFSSSVEDNESTPEVECSRSVRLGDGDVNDSEGSGQPSDNPPGVEEAFADTVESSKLGMVQRVREVDKGPEGNGTVKNRAHKEGGREHDGEFSNNLGDDSSNTSEYTNR